MALRRLFADASRRPAGGTEALVSRCGELAEAGDQWAFLGMFADACAPCIETRLPLCDECMSDAIALREATLTRLRQQRARLEALAHGARADASVLDKPSEKARLRAGASSDSSSADASSSTLSLPGKRAHLRQLRARLQAVRRQRVIQDERLALVRHGEQLVAQERLRLAEQLRRHRDDIWGNRVAAWHVRYTLERLRHIRVLNDALFIWHSGPFATINNCRLGRMPTDPVPWTEINAGLGQLALLLASVAKRLGYVFRAYRCVQ